MEPTFEAIDSQKSFENFQKFNRDPELLAKFLKESPGGHYFKWVKEQIAKYYSNGEWLALEKLTPGRGERKNESNLRKYHIDFLIFDKVMDLRKKGFNLTGEGGCFRILAKEGIMAGKETIDLGFEQIKTRYYRFRNTKPKMYHEDGKIICGPTRVDWPIGKGKIKIIGYWTFTPEKK